MAVLLRFGVLGAARIAPLALVRPARALPDVQVVAVAARDRERAAAFAGKHGIRTAHASYADLLADDDVDAVYVPLPNGLHAEWTLRAIAAGKHVLCEKPLTANAAEAREVADAAERALADHGLVVAEAFHYRHHPMTARMREIVRDEVGALRRVEVTFAIPPRRRSDIRYRADLAGGAFMDTGCYTVDLARLLADATPEVTAAQARTLRSDPRVDQVMTAEVAFPDGATGRLHASIWWWPLLSLRARVVGEHGTMEVANPFQPQPRAPHRITVVTAGRKRTERVAGDTTFLHQLRAFRDAVRDGTPPVTSARAAAATMQVVDDVYRAAGLPVRGT